MSILQNRRNALTHLIFTSDGISRKEIASKLGFDVRTVSSYVDRLLEKKLIYGEKKNPSGRGRSTYFYYPNFESACFAGIAITQTSIDGILCDYHNEELPDRHFSERITEQSKLSFTNKISGRLEKLFSDLRDRYVAGIGVSCSRWLRPPLSEYDLYSDITNFLEHKFNVPVFTNIPINVLVYQLKQENPEESNIMLIHPGNIVETGLMLNNKIPVESRKLEREFQHVTVNGKNGPSCYCGKRGCVENYVSSGAMLDYYRLRKSDKIKETPDNLFILAEQGDSVAEEIINNSGKYLAIAIRKFAEKYKITCVYLISQYTEKVKTHFKQISHSKGGRILLEKYPDNKVKITKAAAEMAVYETITKFVNP